MLRSSTVPLWILLCASLTCAQEAEGGEAADLPVGGLPVADLIEGLAAARWEERQAAHEELLRRGEAVREPVAEALLSKDAEVSLRASQILDGLSRGQERATLQEFRQRSTPESFEEMLLLIARAVDPGVNLEVARKSLEEWGETLRGRIGEETRPRRTLRRVVDYVFSVQGRSALFQREPQDVILTGALANSQIEPLTLAILIKTVARRAGIELSVAKCADRILLVDERDPQAPVWIDLHQSGAMLTRAEAKKLLLTLPRVYEDAMLEPESDRETLQRHVHALIQRCNWFGDAETVPRLGELLQELQDPGQPGQPGEPGATGKPGIRILFEK